ncbi:nitroreductase family protein [Colwellia sp. 1_MG-2023]|uniref:nitroreductase family protein n=1 Tax=Colwellia sp. 1_MG-2023 TaxID=3062649 RepID=UPI0026E1DDC2|nr:nitroreductase family protein [Colwellia sp. 1_MG-2023]MDO6445437.1 nitroreductase family protein [Colwellia sp. 1_MG-2023]
MEHQIITDLNGRYTTKHYDSSRKISKENLNVILEAMRLSASSINSQPWKFIIIESDTAKERMHKTFEENFQFNQKHVFDSSHIILFAHNPRYTRDDYAKVVDQSIKDKRVALENRDQAFGGFAFVDLNTDESGDNRAWTKAQTYIALGNTLHTLARLKIDSTPMEGVDSEAIAKEFSSELDGYICEVGLAIGYKDPKQDYNYPLPKSRLAQEQVIQIL